ELGTGAQVEIMDPLGHRGLHQAERVAVELKRPRSIDDDVGGKLSQLRFDRAGAIKQSRYCVSCAETRTERRGLLPVAPGNNEGRRFAGQQLHQTAAEGTVPAENENLHPRAYSNN